MLVAARSKTAAGYSVLHGLRTTCLPKYMERSAYLATFWRRGRYYRTYPAVPRPARRRPTVAARLLRPQLRQLADTGAIRIEKRFLGGLSRHAYFAVEPLRGPHVDASIAAAAFARLEDDADARCERAVRPCP